MVRDHPYRDSDWLHDKYVGEGLSSRELAAECGVHKSTILKYLHRYGIPVRPSPRDLPPPHRIRPDGYEVVQHETGDTQYTVHIHRLAAVAWFGFDAVADQHVHHKNGRRFDNRECNLEPLPAGEHSAHHRSLARDDDRYTDGEWLREYYVDKEWPLARIASECDVAEGTVHTWMVRHGIERRSYSEAVRLGKASSEDRPWRDSTYNTTKWRQQRARRRELDDDVCQSCGAGDGLVVHHHIPPAEFKSDPTMDVVDAHQLWNLVTLCDRCHGQIKTPRASAD